jgi:hypothetical protein
VSQVELTIEEANKQIARGEALQRLLQNPDFAEIVGEVYYKEEPARLAGLLGDIGGSYRWVPTNQAMSLPPKEFVKMQADIERDLHAIGAFQAFLRVVIWRADMSKQALEEIEADKNRPVDPEDDNVIDFPEA